MNKQNNISLCGDDCSICPRFTAKTEAELAAVAELWQRVGWRDRLCTAEEMRCTGCGSTGRCSYGLLECLAEHNADRCSQCGELPCGKITEVLRRSAEHEKKCREVCTAEEYAILKASFFNKENNLGLADLKSEKSEN